MFFDKLYTMAKKNHSITCSAAIQAESLPQPAGDPFCL
jgi:hypothetical protein